MSLILAAAGRGSRMGDCARELPKTLIREPVSQLPIVHHIYARLEAAAPLQNIIIVGESGSSAASQIATYTRSFPFRSSPTVSVVTGERKGVGWAFFIGIEYALSRGLTSLVLSVADTVAASYRALCLQPGAVVIGVTESRATHGKEYSQVGIDGAGLFLGAASPDAPPVTRSIAGVYRIDGQAIAEYARVFRDEMHRQEYQDARNDNGEYRVSWVWKELSRRGFDVQVADMGPLVEVNFPSDLRQFRDFLAATEE